MIDTNSSEIVPEGVIVETPPPQTKQPSPSNGWCFTLNNYSETEFSSIVLLLEQNDKYWYIVGKEIGEEGTPHLQGYIALKDSKKKFRMTAFEKLCVRDDIKCLRCFRAKGDRFANLNYCGKTDSNAITNIIPKREVKIYDDWTDYPWAMDLIEIIKSEPDERKIYWYWGKQGGGKTAMMKFLVKRYGAIILNGSASNMKNGIIEYEKNNGDTPRVIVSNIPYDRDLDRMSYSGYEDIKDMCFYSGKYEGGMICGANPHLIIFANGPPKTENLKFSVVNI